MKQVPCFFMVGDSILAHPSVITELEKELYNKEVEIMIQNKYT